MIAPEELKLSYKNRGKAISEGHRKHIAEMGYWLTPKFYKQAAEKRRGQHYHSEEFKKRQRERMKKFNPVKLNPEFGFQRGSNNPMFGIVPSHFVGNRNPMKNPEICKMVCEKRIEKLIKGLARKPNYSERNLNGFLQFWFPNEYKYVGDFKVWIGGKNPDFVNVNGQKKIIELFGEFWHQSKDEQVRIDHFKRYGFDTLVIWAKELRNPLKLGTKLRNFHNN